MTGFKNKEKKSRRGAIDSQVDVPQKKNLTCNYGKRKLKNVKTQAAFKLKIGKQTQTEVTEGMVDNVDIVKIEQYYNFIQTHQLCNHTAHLKG